MKSNKLIRAAQRATPVPAELMQMDLCFQRENVSDDSTVVGPAGGALLFLITPTPIMLHGEDVQQQQQQGEVVH